MEEQKKYGIFRIEKVKLCDGGEAMGRLKHAFREFKNDSFDPELTEKNLSFQYSSAKEVMKAYKERVQSITTEKYKPPKNSVGLYECIVTSTAGAIPEEREYEFFEKTYQQLCRTFGEKNVLAGTSHKDETTIHTHWFITPIFNSPFHSAIPPFPAQPLHSCQHSVGLTRRFTSGLGPTFRRWNTTKLAWIPCLSTYKKLKIYVIMFS